MSPLAATDASAAQQTGGGVVTTFTDPGIAYPSDIVTGPDGNLWFNSISTGEIGRITPSGTVTVFPAPNEQIYSLTPGPNGEVWFVYHNTGTQVSGVGEISTDGVFTYFSGSGFSGPQFVTQGPDGAMWFTNGTGNSIGRSTTAGAVTTYTAPSVDVPGSIVTGPDGALWFTNYFGRTIGRITTARSITSFPEPYGEPFNIIDGPDGALWFTAGGSTTTPMGHMTTSGVVTAVHYKGRRVGSLALGPDNAVWFTPNITGSHSEIGRLQSSTEPPTFYKGTGIVSPISITAGPDAAMWFINAKKPDSIGRITTPDVSRTADAVGT